MKNLLSSLMLIGVVGCASGGIINNSSSGSWQNIGVVTPAPESYINFFNAGFSAQNGVYFNDGSNNYPYLALQNVTSVLYNSNSIFWIESGLLKTGNNANLVSGSPTNLISLAQLNNVIYVLNDDGVYSYNGVKFTLIQKGHFNGITATCDKYLVAYGLDLAYFNEKIWHNIPNIYIFNKAASTTDCETYLMNSINLSVINDDDFTLQNINSTVKNMSNIAAIGNNIYIANPNNIYSYLNNNFNQIYSSDNQIIGFGAIRNNLYFINKSFNLYEYK